MYQQPYPPSNPAASPYRSPPPQQPPYGLNQPRPSNGYQQRGPNYHNVPPQPRYPGPSNGQPPLPQPPRQPPNPAPARHKGTLAPGQMVNVGDQAVRIERYLSEGGYAHVYLTSSDRPIYPPTKEDKKGRWGEKGYTQHCLKRLAVQDETAWADVKKEIAVMKALPPNPHLTQYLGSSHTKLPGGGYEVFILMEFCSGGGIIDLLNKRLRDRLTEAEILNIFTDVCEAVAAMHALKRPLLHRDLKIENVLSIPSNQPPSSTRPMPLTFKLCDFGSTTFPAERPPQTKLEADTLALDLNKNTTLQYRSPEMVEPMLGRAVGLPSDVWALGVLLYKLCYYTTPFEEHGPLAIVNAKYTFPQYPVYSPRLQHLIASMLVEQPIRRPTVFEVLKTAHDMEGTRPEIDYPSSSSQSLPSSAPAKTQPKANGSNLLDFTSSSSPVDQTTPVMQPSLASTVQPQRRGRPTPTKPTPAQADLRSMPRPPSIAQSQFAPTPDRESLRSPTPKDSTPKVALQVTGEQAKAQPPAKKTSVDAFGLPTVQPQKSNSTQSGFSDSFGASSTAPKFGLSAQHSSSGFGDSFSARSPTSSASSTLSPKFTSIQPSSSPTAFSGFRLPRTTTPGAASVSSLSKSPEPVTTDVPEDGEVSFETRFPSIETLSSEDTTTPLAQQPTQKSSTDSSLSHLISPVVSLPSSRPEAKPSRPSMLGNMTGENPAKHLSAFDVNQPRSTHVTGTAFKPSGDLLSPGPILTSSTMSQGRSSYFDGSEARPAHIPVDLMTGDNDRMGDDPPSSTTSTSAPRPLPKPPTLTGGQVDARSQYAQLKHTLSSSSSVSKSSEPTSKPKTPVEIEQDSSSSEDEGPEDASASKVRPGSSVEQPEDALARRTGGLRIDTHTGASSKQQPHSSGASGPSYLSGKPSSATSQRARPTSMFVGGSTPAVSDSSADKQPGHHTRKGSISDIVSRYEDRGTSPPKTDFGPARADSSSGLRRKESVRPNVAAKPASLRQRTMSEVKSPSALEPPQTAIQADPPKDSPVEKAETAEKPGKTSKPEKPEKAAKPANIAVRHGDTPRPDGWSRSSSGRSFPISKHTVAPISTDVDKVETGSREVKSPESAASGRSSPEKQQSVNSLIARWNKGDVGASKPIKRTHI